MASDASDMSAAGSPPPENAGRVADREKPTKKRSNSSATDANGSQKVTKRRAAMACVSCRARKVRCDVVEQSPCGNCRWDNVECIVQESRRRKKHLLTASVGQQQQSGATADPQVLRAKSITAHSHPVPISSAADLRRPSSGSVISSSDADASSVSRLPLSGVDSHVPHLIYQRSGYRNDSVLLNKLQPATENPSRAPQPQSQSPLLSQQQQQLPQPQQQQQPRQQSTPQWPTNNVIQAATALFEDNRTAQFLSSLEEHDANAQLPPFVRPLPSKVAPEDVSYLHFKGALTLPTIALQNALLQAYVEYVHPFMPLMDIHEFLSIVNRRDGLNGQTSLFLYQAVMFSATAFVDMKYLREAGYPSRKSARKSFFQKTRLLYDFDYELDRLVLVQALLLMTYWYETPDDQKDTWHWMGVAISLAHTIGLHRNPGSTTMCLSKQKLWKRIWWSCFMRDRLIALGMRRPTRIKDEDYDVPMLEEADFEIQALADNITVIPQDCVLMRDIAMQKELAIMCIAKAQLCVCISHMLKAQYSVLIRDKMKPENTTNSTMMLFPNKQLDNVEGVHTVDMELMAWAESLPACCQYRTLTPLEVGNGKSTVAVQRTLLHMVYYTTISALHRPQFLPSSPTHTPTTSRQVQEMSRLRVRDAAMHITRMASELHTHKLERYLPTTGVTVILPAMIIHLLEMKNPVADARERATYGFRQCMRVMEKLRDIYAAADYATGFLDAALRKAAIDINAHIAPSTLAMMKRVPVEFSAQTPPPENVPYMTASESLFNEKVPQPAKTMMPPNTINAADLEMSAGHSPPHTDVGVTPSASGGSDEVNGEMEHMDLDFMQSHDEFDWNAVAGADFDVDQWLQFPPEGVNASADDFGPGVFPPAVSEDITMTTQPILG
ncbi:unnamed protein product [Clonostachys solani]|uniref:Zn(2)-C6 fungal-type domain-containing protein n=1 Tax=Clonostachys solani TaxID=160281 RepID=A0A9N9ZCY3_9HYPO|nr:unnamed protein product [Clonostachys solani]